MLPFQRGCPCCGYPLGHCRCMEVRSQMPRIEPVKLDPPKLYTLAPTEPKFDFCRKPKQPWEL